MSNKKTVKEPNYLSLKELKIMLYKRLLDKDHNKLTGSEINIMYELSKDNDIIFHIDE